MTLILSRWVYSFFEVAERRSFLRAAQALYISAPALTQQINLLEKELGVMLLERSYRGVQLTKAGQFFYDEMKEAAQRIEMIKQRTIQMAYPKKCDLKIAFTDRVPREDMYAVSLMYGQRELGILRTVPVSADEALDGVMHGRYDGCYMLPGERIRKAGLETTRLFRRKNTLAVPVCSELAQRKLVRIGDLSGMTITLPKYGVFDNTDTFCDEVRESGVDAQILFFENLMESIVYCREKGACHLSVRPVLDSAMVAIPLESKARFSVCLAYRKEARERLAGLIRVTREFDEIRDQNLVEASE